MKDRPFRPRFARQSNVGHPLKNEQIDNIEPPILSFISLPDLMSMAFCFWRKGCRWRLVTAGPDPRVPYTQTPTKGRLRALKKNRIDFYVCLTQMRMTSYLADLNFRLCGYFNRMIDEASLPLMTIPLSERMFG